MEEWKVISVGYKVSNYGNVVGPRGALTPQESSSRGGGIYYRVKVNSKYCAVHRLVATHFLPKPDGKDFIDHIDRNPANNHVHNLRWVTASENMLNTRDRTENRNIYVTKSGRFSVQLRRNHKMVFTTTVDTLEEAIQIRNQMCQTILETHTHTLPVVQEPLQV